MLNILCKTIRRPLSAKTISRFSLENYSNRVRLQKMLLKEYKVNEAFLEQNPADMDLIKEENYTIQDIKGYQYIELSRKLDDHDILIQFKSRAYQNVETESEDSEELEQA